MTITDEIIRVFYGDRLIKREVPKEIQNLLTKEEFYYLSEFGLPADSYDYEYTTPIKMLNTEELIVSYSDYYKERSYILLNVLNHTIYHTAKNHFFGASLKKFIYQAYLIDYFWKVVKQSDMFGGYYSNKQKYAEWFENELLRIDPDLHIHDRSYYWGSMIEGVEQGIFG